MQDVDIDIDKIDNSRDAGQMLARSWQQLTVGQIDRLLGLIDNGHDAGRVLACS